MFKSWSCQPVIHSLYCAVIAVKENLFSFIHEQLKLVKENCLKKNLFIVHTSKENYAKELVKENLVVCAGLKVKENLVVCAGL